ncbi:MAG: divalent-cation tolerance protein CutA, partial [Planctomycetota bacterium]
SLLNASSIMSHIVELTTTVETREQAESLAKKMVEMHLAACIQLMPIQSIYRWQGEVCESEEIRCTMKSSKQMQYKLVAAIQENHPYDVPEILVVEVADAGPDYEAWLLEQLANGE